jgi:hypothetical protein
MMGEENLSTEASSTDPHDIKPDEEEKNETEETEQEIPEEVYNKVYWCLSGWLEVSEPPKK